MSSIPPKATSTHSSHDKIRPGRVGLGISAAPDDPSRSTRSRSVLGRHLRECGAAVDLARNTTKRPLAMPSTRSSPRPLRLTHITAGRAASASSLEKPARSPKPVCTGPGHSVVAVTPVPAQLTGKTLRVGQHERLASAISRLSGQRLESRVEATLRIAPRSRLDHAWQIDCTDQPPRRRRPRSCSSLPSGPTCWRRDASTAGLVDQVSMTRPRSADEIRQRRASGSIGKVHGDHIGAAQLLGQRLELVSRPSHQRDVMPAPRKLAGDLERRSPRTLR